MNKGASCLCLTYGRPALLEEAIESFIRQQWDGPKELIVLNDHPYQELLCDHPEVRIFNLKSRLPTLGEKRNFSVSLARYDQLLIWDDDDIHLPWRIAETMNVLAESQYFKSRQLWVWEHDAIYQLAPPEEEWYHCTSGYSRTLFEELGGYRPINTGEDVTFELRLKASSAVGKFWRLSALPLERLYYIYRVTHGHYHTSGCTDLTRIEPDIKPGQYQVQPHWERDYCKDVEQEIQRMLCTQQQPELHRTAGRTC